MPFTPAHAAAALPFRRWSSPGPYIWPALVIGTIAPDLEYFLLLRGAARWGHDFVGSFAFCLPVGLLAMLLWTKLGHRAALLLAPDDHRLRWWSTLERRYSAREWTLFIPFSLLVGSWTHLLWDAFTHQGRWGGKLIPAIESVAFTIADRDFYWTNVFQQGSTLLGMLILVIAYLNATRRRERTTEPTPRLAPVTRLTVVTLAIALPITFGLFYAAQRAAYTPGFEYYRAFIGSAARGTLAAWIAAAILVSVGIWFAAPPERQPAP